MLLLPTPLVNKPYSPEHEEYQACTSILTPLTNRLQTLLVVYLVKLRLTSFKTKKNCISVISLTLFIYESCYYLAKPLNLCVWSWWTCGISGWWYLVLCRVYVICCIVLFITAIKWVLQWMKNWLGTFSFVQSILDSSLEKACLNLNKAQQGAFTKASWWAWGDGTYEKMGGSEKN